MMTPKQRRKSNHCLNCNLRIESIYNFCPQCGQENTNNKVSIIELLKDVYDDYITFDSRLIRSLKPFIFSPGKLTNSFNEGRRIDYVHPVRFYLLLSVFYFFVFTHVFDLENVDFGKYSLLGQLNEESKKDSLQNLAIGANIDSTVSIDTAKQRGKVLLRLQKKLKSLERSRKESEEDKDTTELVATVKQIEYLQDIQSTLLKNAKFVVNMDTVNERLDQIDEKFDKSGGNDINIPKFVALLKDKNTTENALLDSMHIKKRNDFTAKFAHQLLKIGRNDLSIFLQSMVDNIPIMMTLILPLMALLLKLIYIRSSRLYIEHLVFAFHVQSFIYLGLMVSFLVYYFLSYQNPAEISAYTSLILSVYVVLMFKNVYKQGWVKTAFKAGLLSFAYSIVLIIFLAFEILISFLLY
jgi:hypothetical protein